ncbi:MAG: glycosyltransferase family 4 protein [Fimbriimonadales bacterium]|nr:glycosyltransferase family 4 protein [Fimbriimonadales bacterium]
MRICILNEFFYPDMMGGTGMVLSDLARRLHDTHGVEIDVWTSGNSYRGGSSIFPPSETWNGIRIRRLRVRPVERSRTRERMVVNLWFALKVLLRLALRHPYDCVIVSSAPPSLPLAAWFLRKVFGIPYLYVVYDLEPDRAVALSVASPQNPAVRWAHALQRAWLRGAARVVAIGRCMRDHLIESYGLDPESVSVLEIGADPQAIAPRQRDNAVRRRFLPDGGFLVVNSGNFARYHDFDAILDAAKLLQDSAPDVRILLVGNGVKEQHVRARVRHENIANVWVEPFLPADEYVDLLAAADLCLVTLEEGMLGLCVPSKFYSILSAGRPTLAMMDDRCEVARVIREEDCGEVVPPASAESLAEAIRRLKEQPETLDRMGRNARRALEARFTYEAVTGKLHRMLLLEARLDQANLPGAVL